MLDEKRSLKKWAEGTDLFLHVNSVQRSGERAIYRMLESGTVACA